MPPLRASLPQLHHPVSPRGLDSYRPKGLGPKVSSSPVRIVRMSGPALHFGVKEYTFSGATLRVFSPPKTVADCLKFRNKIGLDVAIEALKESRREEGDDG